MITNWDLSRCDYKGGTSKRDYIKLKATIDGCNIVGKSIYVYYYYSTYDKRGNASYSDPRLLTNRIAPFDLEILYYGGYKTSWSNVFVLFSNKQMNVSTITTDVPKKFWYMFGLPSETEGKNPARYVYEPRRPYSTSY